MAEKVYEIYFDIDNYLQKSFSGGKNIEEDLVGKYYDYEKMMFSYQSHCKRAAMLAEVDKGCTRFNVHVICGWQTILSKNYYSKKWIKEVGVLPEDASKK